MSVAEAWSSTFARPRRSRSSTSWAEGTKRVSSLRFRGEKVNRPKRAAVFGAEARAFRVESLKTFVFKALLLGIKGCSGRMKSQMSQFEKGLLAGFCAGFRSGPFRCRIPHLDCCMSTLPRTNPGNTPNLRMECNGWIGTERN